METNVEFNHEIMEENVELSHEIINDVYEDIMCKYDMTTYETYRYITRNANLNNQSREEYIFNYYEDVILNNNKNYTVNIEDIDKVNFEKLTKTDKKVIASSKYMCHAYVKEIVYRLNELINKDLSNDGHGVDEASVIMYAIQAIDRDVANAVSDCQKVLRLMKSKCS